MEVPILMTIRPFRSADFPALRAMAEASGFPYPDVNDPLVEAILVAVNEVDEPLLAVGAKRLVELYLWCGKGLTPHENIAALRMLHDAMAAELKTRGYNSVETFLPPSVSGKFGKRLEKTFGWVRNPWASWTRRF